MIAGGRNSLIGISGKIGSGKDTVGNILQLIASNGDLGVYKTDLDFVNGGDHIREKCSNYQIKKFAGKLKEIAALLIGCDVSDFEDREFKEKELGEEWWYYCNSLFFNGETKIVSYSEANDAIRDNTSWYIVKLTPRKLLQLLGTEAGRNVIHPNIWVNALFADYNTLGFDYEGSVDKEIKGSWIYPNWIITDVRFSNEAQAIKDRGGIVIRVNRLDVDKFTTNFPQTLHPSETALDNYNFDYVINNEGSIEELIEKIKQLKLV